MVYGKTKLATDFTVGAMNQWRVRLLRMLLFFVPRANPDSEALYPQVRAWALELTDDLWPLREVALDENDRPLFKSPNGRNFGFWPDMAYQQLDVADLDPLSEHAFESLWSALPDSPQ
jgi:hypothetical protein